MTWQVAFDAEKQYITQENTQKNTQKLRKFFYERYAPRTASTA